MPLHIDVRINEDLIERFHIGRFGDTSTVNGQVYQYRVVISEKKTVLSDEFSLNRKQFDNEPDWLEWEETPYTFTHRYGDGVLVCIQKALAAVTQHRTTAEEL